MSINAFQQINFVPLDILYVALVLREESLPTSGLARRIGDTRAHGGKIAGDRSGVI